jgi:hypothetical protein
MEGENGFGGQMPNIVTEGTPVIHEFLYYTAWRTCSDFTRWILKLYPNQTFELHEQEDERSKEYSPTWRIRYGTWTSDEESSRVSNGEENAWKKLKNGHLSLPFIKLTLEYSKETLRSVKRLQLNELFENLWWHEESYPLRGKLIFVYYGTYPFLKQSVKIVRADSISWSRDFQNVSV